MSNLTLDLENYPARNSVETLLGLSKIYEGFRAVHAKLSKNLTYFLILGLFVLGLPLILVGLLLFFLWLNSFMRKSTKEVKVLADELSETVKEYHEKLKTEKGAVEIFSAKVGKGFYPKLKPLQAYCHRSLAIFNTLDETKFSRWEKKSLPSFASIHC